MRIITALALMMILGVTPLCSKTAAAATINEVQHLHFGTFGFKGGFNSAGKTILVSPDGTYNTGIGIVMSPMDPPRRAQYALAGMPASQPLTITFEPTTTTITGGSGSMTINSFQSNNPSTDPSGNATLYFGATLTTMGSSISANYDGDISIIIDF
jgi:hypothetical protein